MAVKKTTELNVLYDTYKLQLLVYVFKSLYTRNNMNLVVARGRMDMTKQRIGYMGIQKFNFLPDSLKSINRISIFKSNLKKDFPENIQEFVS